MAPPKTKRLSSLKKQETIPNWQAFLNTLSADEAKAWKEDIVTSLHYVKSINSRHLPTLTVNELKSLKNITPHEDKKLYHILKFFYVIFVLEAYFEKWMQCEIREKDIKNAPSRHPDLYITENSPGWQSLTDKLKDFCLSNSIQNTTIQIHHISLRSKLSTLPLLSIQSGGQHCLFKF